MEGIKVRGKGCPKPVKEWAQAGVAKKVLDTLKKYVYLYLINYGIIQIY